MAKKSYRGVLQVVEMTVEWNVRASSAEEANEIATARTQKLCSALSDIRKNITFGDVSDDYVAARDDEPEDEEKKGYIER